MANINNWSVVGVVNAEPKLMKIKDNKVLAKTVLVIRSTDSDEKTYLPVVAYNKKAHVLCSLAHRGSTIFAKGVIKSSINTTSKQGKTLVCISFKITDFSVLIREAVESGEDDFVETVQLYDPEAYMDSGESEEENES